MELKHSSQKLYEQRRYNPVKMKPMALLMALAMLVCAMGVAMAEEAKVLVVNGAEDRAEGEYETVLAALTFIKEQGYPEGYTIEIKAGTYDRFYVSAQYKNLTIKAAEGAEVIINVLDGRTNQNEVYGGNIGADIYGDQCVAIRGNNITISGLTFKYCGDRRAWFDSAIGVYTVSHDGYVAIDNCIFDGTDYSKVFGVFLQNYTNNVSVTNCKFYSVEQAINGENSSFWPVAFDFSNNYFKDCSFAIHYGYNSGNIITNKKLDEEKLANYNAEGNYWKVTNNIIEGSDTLRNKIVMQDSYDTDMCTVTISGNKLTNGLIGIVNIAAATGQLQSDVLSDNIFSDSSFVVDATYDYANSTEKVGVYMADEEDYGMWVLPEGSGIENLPFYDLIKQAVEEANRTGSKVLQITGLEGYEEVMYTFTWYKDGIYWKSLPKPTPTPKPATPRPTAVPTATPSPTPDMSDLPDTGDNTSLELFAVLMVMSFAGLTLLLRKRSA